MGKPRWLIGKILRPRNNDPARVVDVIEGGWGIVYIVEDLHKGYRTAIKTLQERFLRNEFVVRRFIQEAHLWMSLGQHPNIVTVYGADAIQGRPCIFMEYISGGSLRSRLSVDPMPVGWVTDIAVQFACGMRYVWQVGRTVHRDLKPDNLMLTLDGRLKITDFGMAHAIGISGTPAYMSPEQFHSYSVDTRADIYAFGLILFEMLTGTLPHYSYEHVRLGKAEVSRLAKRRSSEPVVDPRRWNPEIPDGLAGLVLDCLKMDPTERPESFEAICFRLEQFGTSQQIDEAVLPVGSASRWADGVFGPRATQALELASRGAALASIGRRDEALALYDQALALNDQIDEIWKNKATSLLKLGRFEESLGCSEHALALYSQYSNQLTVSKTALMSMTNKSAALIELGEFEQALLTCEEGLRMDPAYARLWNNKAVAYLGRYQLQEASECIDRALHLEPGYEKALSVKGKILRLKNDPGAALKVFELILARNPRSFDGTLGKAACLMDMGREEEAESLARVAYSLDPKALRRFLQKMLQAKIIEFGKRHDSEDLDTFLEIADTAQGAGDYGLALEYYSRAAELDPDHVRALLNKGHCLYELGNRAEGAACFRRVLDLKPGEPDALLNMSRFYLDTHDIQGALEFAERAIQANPQADMAWHNQGCALAGMEKWDEAFDSFGTALRLNPNNFLSWFMVGQIRVKDGNRSGAETCFLEVLAINPEFAPALEMLEKVRK
ncbi:MAG: serine/threonine-protein kinase [Chloroflexota bacterium]|nr:MAG: serine/threonine-protein kinase [Chloroflexota bacterium]